MRAAAVPSVSSPGSSGASRNMARRPSGSCFSSSRATRPLVPPIRCSATHPGRRRGQARRRPSMPRANVARSMPAAPAGWHSDPRRRPSPRRRPRARRRRARPPRGRKGPAAVPRRRAGQHPERAFEPVGGGSETGVVQHGGQVGADHDDRVVGSRTSSSSTVVTRGSTGGLSSRSPVVRSRRSSRPSARHRSAGGTGRVQTRGGPRGPGRRRSLAGSERQERGRGQKAEPPRPVLIRPLARTAGRRRGRSGSPHPERLGSPGTCRPRARSGARRRSRSD